MRSVKSSCADGWKKKKDAARFRKAGGLDRLPEMLRTIFPSASLERPSSMQISREKALNSLATKFKNDRLREAILAQLVGRGFLRPGDGGYRITGSGMKLCAGRWKEPDPKRPRYSMFGRDVNAPEALARVHDSLPPPEICRYCAGTVDLVNNSVFYGGKEYGWPLAYRCSCCGARVGCHPDTDLPLGTLANEETMKARRDAHAAFDVLWKGRTDARSHAYKALAKAMGMKKAHISWLDAEECRRIVELCRTGTVLL